MNKAKEKVPASSDVKRKLTHLALAHDYKYTPEDISAMLEAKRKVGKLPVKLASEKARIIAARDAARDTDLDEYVRLCEEVVRLEELAKQRHELLSQGSKSANVANINLKNKQRNFDKSHIEASKEEKSNNELDPFSRRKTFPRALLARKKTEFDAAEAHATTEDTPTSGATNNNNNINNNNKVSPLKKSLNLSNDKLRDPGRGLHDEHSGIDIDIPVELVSLNLSTLPKQLTTPIAPLPLPTQATAYVSPSSTASSSASKLSLADYMRRRRALE